MVHTINPYIVCTKGKKNRQLDKNLHSFRSTVLQTSSRMPRWLFYIKHYVHFYLLLLFCSTVSQNSAHCTVLKASNKLEFAWVCVLVDAPYLLSSLFCSACTPYVRSCCVDVASAIHADHLLVFIGNIFITFNKKLENIVLIMGCIVKHSTRMTYFYWSAHDVSAIRISHITHITCTWHHICHSVCFLHVRVCSYAHYDLYEHVWRYSCDGIQTCSFLMVVLLFSHSM